MADYLLYGMIALVFAIMNRARGSQFFSLTDSTTEGRLLSTFLMTASALVPFTGFGNPEHQIEVVAAAWALLYVWTVPGWDAYWSAAIGNDPSHSKLWGIGMMTLRQGGLLLPYYAFLSGLTGDWHHMAYAASTLLCGAVYAFWGAVNKTSAVIEYAELTNGAIMGLTTVLILWG